MVDFTATQDRAKGAVPSANRQEGHTEATTTKTLSTIPSPTTDVVDNMYHQLAEIHAIAVVKLAECAHWHRSDLTSSPVRARTGWQRLSAEPSAAMLIPLPPTDFAPQATSW
jgi:hypothetical protein